MEIIVKVPSGSDRVRVLGPAERTLKLLREALGVNVAARDGRVHVTGDRAPVLVARNVLEYLSGAAMRGEEMPSRQRVLDLIAGEADAVGERLGLAIPEPIDQRLQRTGATAHRMSMLQDLESGRALEFEVLAASYAEMRELAGLPTPTLDTVYGLMALRAAAHARQRGGAAPRP